MIRLLVIAYSIACAVVLPSQASADDQVLIKSPVAPLETLRNFAIDPELKIELAASEPNVISPVAIRFDEGGRMWVVEMRDYPTPATESGQSRICVLEDRDHDGLFETNTLFADHLLFATGVQPWRGGAFVTSAGKIAYMKDTNGDGYADLVETWYTGFSQENPQLRANHPRLALDNHIYVAGGLRGGNIVDAAHPDAKPVSISGMDFRFDPVTRKCEAVSGPGQFGLTFDDFGNRFVCSNRNPAIHIVLEDQFLKKNPLIAARAVNHDVAKAGDESHVFPITSAWVTSNLHEGQFTAACGVEIYRGDALPGDYYGNVFTCEPTNHLVHREIMRPDGVTFASTPAYENREFLASRDPWFSPVNLEVGPDGALYVVDMYRAVIEHPEWMPIELRNRPDLFLGNDLGRIYRIAPKDFARQTAPKLSGQSNQALVESLAHPNAWRRETAARLLLERQDKSVGKLLEKMAISSDSPAGAAHALRLLESLGLLSDGILLRALDSGNPRVVEQATLAAESRIATSNQLREKISQLAFHTDARVRFQSLLAALPLPSPPRSPTDSWELHAILVATGNRGGEALSRMFADPAAIDNNVAEPKQFIADLARLAAASRDDKQQSLAMAAILFNSGYRRVGLTSFLSEAFRNGKTLEEMRATLSEPQQSELNRTFDEARNIAGDSTQSETDRGEAIDLLALAPNNVGILTQLALNDPNQVVRLRAIVGLEKQASLEPWKELLASYDRATPLLQRAILNGLLSSTERTSFLLDEIAAGRIKPGGLDTSFTPRLLKHRDEQIRQRAETLFADAIPKDRQQALADYQSVLTMKANALHGRQVFEKNCATCHRIAGSGTNIAPDISDSRSKTPAQYLTDIIQPNRAIDSNYFSYTAVTTGGEVHTGILAAETSNSIVLKQAEGKTVTLLRKDIDELNSNGVSLMPEGLEKLIPPQDMADLISYIKNWRYLDGTVPLAPHEPAAVK